MCTNGHVSNAALVLRQQNWSRIYRLMEESDDEDFIEEDDSLLETFVGDHMDNVVDNYIHVH